MVQAARRCLVCPGGWAGFNAEKAGWTQCPSQNIRQGSSAWVSWTHKDREEGSGLALVTGVAHCLSGTHKMGALVEPKEENWHWLRGRVCSESKGDTWSWSTGEKVCWDSCPLQTQAHVL